MIHTDINSQTEISNFSLCLKNKEVIKHLGHSILWINSQCFFI